MVPILSRMVSISISDVTFNSAVRVLFNKKSFKFSMEFVNPKIAVRNIITKCIVNLSSIYPQTANCRTSLQ